MKFSKLLLLLTIIAVGARADVGKPVAHEWEYITYVSPDSKYSFIVGFGHKGSGLRLDIGGVSPDFLETNVIDVRLHRTNGVILLQTNRLIGPIGINSSWDLSAFFPWTANSLTESWFEVMLGKERYWIEVPYGFDRDPKDPLPPPNDAGPSKLPATVHFKKSDHIEKWTSIEYDLGEIQNHWRLLLRVSDERRAPLDVVLYRDDSQDGKSFYLWKIHSPQTSLALVDWKGSVTEGFCDGIRMHDDGMRRSDLYRIYDNRPKNERFWGTLKITVDDRSFEAVLPSSVFRYGHHHYMDPQKLP